jgi:hypothetical protein
MMDILSENSKEVHPKSVTELLSLQEKRFVLQNSENILRAVILGRSLAFAYFHLMETS